MLQDSQTFNVEKDTDLSLGLRKFYIELMTNGRLDAPILIRLPSKPFLTAYSLNVLLIFIEAVLSKKRDVKIYVSLFDQNVVSNIMDNKFDFEKDLALATAITKKIIFYEAMELLPLLRKSGVIVQPSKTTYEKLRDILNAFKKERQWQYSSKMLALSPLIENEEEQHALTTRMRTLTNILYKNLYGRIEFSTAREASSQIMFELVKNIYQHSDIKDTGVESYFHGTLMARGFACAQIIKFPIIQSSKYPNEFIVSHLEGRRPGIIGKKWRYLSISITDHGISVFRLSRHS